VNACIPDDVALAIAVAFGVLGALFAFWWEQE